MISAVFLSFQTDMPAVHGLGGMIWTSAWGKRGIHDSEMVPATTADWCHATRISGKGCAHALAHGMAGQGSPLSIPRMGRAHGLAHGREERRRFQIVSRRRAFAYNPHCAYVRKTRGTEWARKGYCLMSSYNTDETLKGTAYSQWFMPTLLRRSGMGRGKALLTAGCKWSKGVVYGSAGTHGG